MPETTPPYAGNWTATDLVEHFGPMPLSRVRQDPAPGTATPADVTRIHERENRLFELVDGTLLEKTVGTYESYLAAILVRIMGNFVVENHLGVILGADGMMEIAPGLVRIPDVSFISWDRLPNRSIPTVPIASIVPDLAVEIVSPSNTKQEMDRKLDDYFRAGVRLVWYIYPKARYAHAYQQPANQVIISKDESLDGLHVLKGFSFPLSTLFEK